VLIFQKLVNKILNKKTITQEDLNGCFYFEWEGRAISKNRKIVKGYRNDRTSYSRRNGIYDEFVTSLAWTMVNRKNITGIETFQDFDMILISSIGKLADPQNFEEPFFDALEKARVIKNDKNVCNKFTPKPHRHDVGEFDRFKCILIRR
jgi:hypothetical protein